MGQHGDKEKISELGRMGWKLASFMMSSTSEEFEALGFPFPCNWQLVRMAAYVGNDSMPVWSFTLLAQAAGPFAGSWSGLHSTDCQMGFAALCWEQYSKSFSAICVRERQLQRPGHCRRRQLDLLVLPLGVPGTVLLRLLTSRRCLSGRNAEKIREVWKVGSKGHCRG